jgi:hypothetical protein
MRGEDAAAMGGLFRALAEIDFRGFSPLYDRLATEASNDPEILSLLLPAGPTDRLPHLLFGAVQYLLLAEGSDPLTAFASQPFATFRSWCLDHGPGIEKIVATHVVQTNEVGRCAMLLPCLDHVARRSQRPLALLEVGTSAGLNLLFDHYRYGYGADATVGPADSDLVIRPDVEGAPDPALSLPEVVWRRGLDRSPLDVTDEEAVRWLRACIWPEQLARIELLTRAVEIARRVPPVIIRGDVYETLPDLVRAAPPECALCVVHTAVLPYLPDRPGFVELLRKLATERPIWWVSGEAHGLIPELLSSAAVPGQLVNMYGVVPLGLAQERPRQVALAGSHGTWMRFVGDEPAPSGGAA